MTLPNLDGTPPTVQLKLFNKLIVASFLSCLYYIFFYLSIGNTRLLLIPIAAFVAFLVLLLIGKMVKQKVTIFRVAILIAFLTYGFQTYYTGGISSSTIPHLIIASLFAFFYNKKKDIYFFFSLSLLSIIAFTIGSYLFTIPNYISPRHELIFNGVNHFYSLGTLGYYFFVFRLEVFKSNRKLKRSMSDLEDATQKMVQSEKFASLGEMTAGIAHEINNPINYIQGNAILISTIVSDLIRLEEFRAKQDIMLHEATTANDKEAVVKAISDSLEEGKALKEKIEFDIIKEEVDVLLDGLRHGVFRTSEIVKSLRVYAGAGNPKQSPFEVNECIDIALTLVNHLLEGNVEVVKEYGELPRVIGNVGKLSQVVINLISNSIHAMEKNENSQIIIASQYQSDESVIHLRITDNGPGIPESIQQKVFNPFFTTKEVGIGTGMGLSISKQMIEDLGGKIAFESSSQNGTTFLIELPSEKNATA